jgi:dodecin
MNVAHVLAPSTIGGVMPDKTFKLIELVGSSEESIQQAVRNAIKRASASIKGISWFEVTQVRGQVAGGEVSQFQVTLKVGFRILDEAELGGT